MRTRLTILAVVLLGFAAGRLADARPAKGEIILATTTSTQDSGLLDVLVPAFEKAAGYRVKTIAVGTGQSLAMGARGDADVVLVHAPSLEKKYVAEGAYVNRRLVMYNDFVIVGPPSDPAGIRGLRGPAGALRTLVDRGATFVSRGDNSGTHILEKALWEKAGRHLEGPLYIQVGQGMGATLNVASQKGAYTLTDRGTFLALRRRLNLDILVEKGKALLNIYHVLEVNPARFPKVNQAGARALADFLVAPATQKVVETFGVDRFGQPLFFPAAGKTEAELLGGSDDN
jgi:tungstate transport system substrate-binding protein